MRSGVTQFLIALAICFPLGTGRCAPTAAGKKVVAPAARQANLSRQLIKALLAEDADGVRQLLAAGASPNCVAPEGGFTALQAAATRSNSALMKLLLEKGADVNGRARTDRSTALMTAVSIAEPEQVKLLLERKADVSLRDHLGQTALHGAAGTTNPEMTRLLLEHGADPNAADDDGETPLMAAANVGNLAAVKMLLEHHATLDAKNMMGETALRLATASRATSEDPTERKRLDEIIILLKTPAK